MATSIGTTIHFQQRIQAPLNFSCIEDLIEYLHFAKERMDKQFSRHNIKDKPDGVLEFNISVGSLAKMRQELEKPEGNYRFEFVNGERLIPTEEEDEPKKELIVNASIEGIKFIAKI